MAPEDNNPDRLLSEPLEPASQQSQRERTGSMSLGAAPNTNGDDVSPINGDSASDAPAPAPPAALDPYAKAVHDVISSDIGVSTLLNRLKQSIASAKEFALFLKKRSTLEEEHSAGLKKLCRVTTDSIRRPDHRHGSFLQSYEEVASIHDRMAENGQQFAISLHQMHEDLLDMASNMERSRKHWKTSGLASEQRVADAEAALRKSKAKYDGLAEDYDRAKTGEKQSGKIFGLKGPKSAQQHEEDLNRKLQAADSDYQAKVHGAQNQRAELVTKLRPEAVKSLMDSIKECDSALTLQMQKFASFNEKLLLSNGLNISPLKGNEGRAIRSLREVVYAINNEKDLSNYISSFATKIPIRDSELKYEKHPVLVQQSTMPPGKRQSDPPTSSGPRPQAQAQAPAQALAPAPAPATSFNQSPHQSHMSQPMNQYNQGPPLASQQHERSFSQGPSMQQYGAGAGAGAMGTPSQAGRGHGPSHGTGSISSSGPPQLSTLSFQTSQTPPPMAQQLPTQPNPSVHPPAVAGIAANLPPLRPVFGMTLEQLFERDGSAVPMVVYQCILAVQTYGLEVEGIYRLSGTASHVSNLKAMFDNDASKVDFRDPAAFMHDVNSVAGLLKQFFRDLPDPLLTEEHYSGFIEAARNEDDIVRRDSLHAIINSLPDPNYATLRALTLHLNKVQENSHLNRMNASNLAIVFGPTLMGTATGPNIQDAGWQVRVIDTILQNTYQIFDED